MLFGLPCWLSGKKNLPANAGAMGSIPGLGRSPGGRKWQLAPVFLPGESHKHDKELDTTDRLSTHTLMLFFQK